MKNLILFLIVLFFLGACNNSATEAIAVEDVLLSQSVIALKVGEQFILKAKVMPENATNQNVNWSSSNTEIASVSNSGTVKAEGAYGTAVITVTTQDGNKTSTCNVTVNENIESVTSITLDRSQETITLNNAGDTIQLHVTVKPDGANQEAVWTSSNPSVASVAEGIVTANSQGKTRITVKSAENSGLQDYCDIIVQGAESANKIIVGYVTSWKTGAPDPTYLTHINYAFGTINMSNFTQVVVDNPSRLRNTVMPLKNLKPTLKILLSIGGWGTDGFSQMASTAARRSGFAASCKSVIDDYGLDGIDLDWEYPTSNMADIAASPSDKANFTLLVKEIRTAIGNDKLLTIAAPSNADYYDFPSILNYIDYINLMTYDMGNPPYHNAPLYPSSMEKWGSCSESVQSYVNKGVPTNKLTLGIPFYGHGDPAATNNDIPSDVEYYRIAPFINTGKYKDNWDDTAKAPYLTNSAGKYVCSYDDARSIAAKCQFILNQGMLGAMFWEYDQDDSNGTLRKAVYNGVNSIE